MGGLGFDELLLIILIAILAFGKDLPRVARKAGLFIRRARRYLLDIKEDIERQIPMEELDLQEDIDNADAPPPQGGSQDPLPYIPEEDLLEEEEEEGEEKTEKDGSADPLPEETASTESDGSGEPEKTKTRSENN